MQFFEEVKEKVSRDGATVYRAGVRAEAVEKVMANKGKLSRAAVLC